MREAGKMVNYFQMGFETGLREFLGVGFEIIDPGDAVEEFKLQLRMIPQKLADGSQLVWANHNKPIQGVWLRVHDGRAELMLEQGRDFASSHQCVPLKREGFPSFIILEIIFEGRVFGGPLARLLRIRLWFCGDQLLLRKGLHDGFVYSGHLRNQLHVQPFGFALNFTPKEPRFIKPF